MDIWHELMEIENICNWRRHTHVPKLLFEFALIEKFPCAPLTTREREFFVCNNKFIEALWGVATRINIRWTYFVYKNIYVTHISSTVCNNHSL